ncbi:MAG: tetratricopeptide repeat protein [Acidobacteriota bacterium]
MSGPDGRRPSPPNNPAEFESLCLDVWRLLWNDPAAQKVGRPGQKQHGLDILDSTGRRAVQCKQRNASIQKWLTVDELDDEVGKVVESKRELDCLVVATTGPTDIKLQNRAAELTRSHPFEVQVWSWSDIWHEIYTRPALHEQMSSLYWLDDTSQRIAPSRLPTAPEHLIGRDDELTLLDDAWTDPTTRVFTLVAWGGVGKTSLVAWWAAHLTLRGYDGADVFDWSFYSQGSRDQTSATADRFLDRALRFFGDDAMADSARSPHEKGARLAALVARRKTLLVLDGLEPLQHGEKSPLSGELKDPALRALLRGLAQRSRGGSDSEDGGGLCVVTTRVSVKDLATYYGTTAPEHQLDHLSTNAGVALLEALEVEGAQRELEALVDEVRGHALTLNLLGRYLRDAYDGDVRKRDTIDFAEAADEQGGHAFRVMEAYEGWFEAEGAQGARALAVLRLMGLFDRPADNGCLEALRQPPVIDGLTDALVSLRTTQWKTAVRRLDDAGLVVRGADGSLDAHPLVREHFARRLRQESEAAWRAAHGRLYEHLTSTTEHRPETLEGLQPLYQAVAHGCQAERHLETLTDVYDERILRGMDHDGFYSTKRLGAFGADLGAVTCFFEEPWRRLTPSLVEPVQAWLLNQAATRLRALGRLREGVEPLRTGLDMRIRQEIWVSAARMANNLSELELTLGAIDDALRDAEQSVEFADRSDAWDVKMITRTTLADALHHSGQSDRARESFREAEAMQAENQQQYPLLYGVQGFQYCDLILADAEHAAAAMARSGVGLKRMEVIEGLADVERRASTALSIVLRGSGTLLSIGLNLLAIGRVRLYRTLLGGSPVDVAEDAIERAVDGLRRSGQTDYLPRGLLTRAWQHTAHGATDAAHTDLDEAEEIALRGPMPLHLADINLHRARLFHDRAALDEARRLVEKHGYGRRLPDIEALEASWSERGASPNGTQG